MDKNINDFLKAFHESADCERALRREPSGYGGLDWENIFNLAANIAADYCDAQIRAYHRWMTDDELP